MAAPARGALLAPALLGLVAAAQGQPVFQTLGIAAGDTVSTAYAVSADGLTVVGGGSSSGRAWWWRAGSGLTLIPGLASGTSSRAVSGDGTTVVGPRPAGNSGFQYTIGGSLVFFPFIPSPGAGGTFTGPAGCSTNGSIAVGTGLYTVSVRMPILHAPAGYTVLPVPASGYGVATAVSGDGSVVAGNYYNPANNAGPAFVWTAAGGAVTLGYLNSSPPPASAASVALDISADGLVVVGRSTADNTTSQHAFRWTQELGMVDLWPDVPGLAIASGVSDYGTTVVGDYQLSFGPTAAFIWTGATGPRDLWDVLTRAGADLTGWQIIHASGVSADGRTIVGSAIDPGGTQLAFVAHLPSGACYANCDGSSLAPVLNINDFTCFLNKFAAGDPAANCDGSTIPPVLNVNDFICFQTQFAAGCP